MKNIKQVVYATVATAIMVAPLMVGAIGGAAIGSPATPGSTGVANTDTAGTSAGLTNTTVYVLVKNVMNWLLGIIGVLAVIAFVISGILYLTAAGDEEQIEKAKAVMMYAIIGLIVAFIGLIVVNAIAGLTGAGGTTTY